MNASMGLKRKALEETVVDAFPGEYYVIPSHRIRSPRQPPTEPMPCQGDQMPSPFVSFEGMA